MSAAQVRAGEARSGDARDDRKATATASPVGDSSPARPTDKKYPDLIDLIDDEWCERAGRGFAELILSKREARLAAEAEKKASAA